jgi:hypothetical protein
VSRSRVHPVGVLHGFTWRDVVPCDAALIRPYQDGIAGELAAVPRGVGWPAPASDAGARLDHDVSATMTAIDRRAEAATGNRAESAASDRAGKGDR